MTTLTQAPTTDHLRSAGAWGGGCLQCMQLPRVQVNDPCSLQRTASGKYPALGIAQVRAEQKI
jgi:hypothetical protein